MLNEKITIEFLNQLGKGTMTEHLGIEFLEVSQTHLLARMPVDSRTVQPYRMLHGGASVVLAETLGSVGSFCHIDAQKYYCVGLEINANHIKGVAEGNFVIGRATPIHLGGRTHIWEIRITNQQEQLVCISRLTIAVLDKKP